MYDSVRKEVLYNILNEFSTPIELVKLITMCLVKYSIGMPACIGKYLFGAFLI
jgi:hypothetical protein